MPRLFATIISLLAFSIEIHLTFAAHAGFHVQFPWTSRGPNLETRPGLVDYNPFCGKFFSATGIVPVSF